MRAGTFRVAFPVLLIVAPAVFYFIVLQRGWVAAGVELGLGLILLPLVNRSRTNLRFAINSINVALVAWLAALVVYLALNPPE